MSGRIYSIPDIKEPEKSSSWEHKGEPSIDLRDAEGDRVERQKRELRGSMAPPDSLGLCPLLEEQRIKYGIPDGVFKIQAVFDRIFVYPIDPFDGKPTYGSTGTILKPDIAIKKDLQEGARGVLVSAGLTAADRLMSHGIELGHVVMTNKNVPFSRVVQEFSDFKVYVLVMRDGDLAGSETLMNELRGGVKHVIDAGDDSYCHQFAGKKKQSVYVADTW